MISSSSRARAALSLAVAGAAFATGSAIVTGSAQAAPVTVNLRVEGQTATIFEGPITTDAHMGASAIPGKDHMSGVVGPHPCDYNDNGSSAPNGTANYATPTTALYDATRQLGITFGADWYGGGLNDFFVNQVGTDTGGNGGWGFAVNYNVSSVGGCQLGLAPQTNVIWSSDSYGKPFLMLAGPATANVGQPVTVRVSDGSTGAAVSGAAVGAANTDASGNAGVTFSQPGTQSLKASKTGAIRSNRLDVCVHNGNDGTCGTPASTPAGPATPGGGPAPAPGSQSAPAPPSKPLLGTITAPREGVRYSHGHGPRILRGSVSGYGAELKTVYLRLTRRHLGRCTVFNGRSERFHRRPCSSGPAPFFSIGAPRAFTYLLPHALPAGHYVLDIETVNGAGQRDRSLRPGRSRVTFDVR